MTVGEKIKYCRKELGITQDKLAELTGIHPVSIRKYETNKMQPRPSQLEKIATALGVSYNALNGSATAGLRLETTGDLIGVFIVLCNSGILQISGKRDSENYLEKETVTIHVNPILSSYLEFEYTHKRKNKSFPLSDILLNIKDPEIWYGLLSWEKMDFLYRKALNAVGENPNKETIEAINTLTENKETVELELQRFQTPLHK